MKYFALFVVFGLFALSQASPVEESKEKRLFFNKETLDKIVGLAKGACEKMDGSEQTPSPLISRACACLRAATGIVSLFDDESVVQEKRIFGIDFKALVAKVSNMIDKVCKKAPSQFDDLCKCISF